MIKLKSEKDILNLLTKQKLDMLFQLELNMQKNIETIKEIENQINIILKCLSRKK
jgi:hypothetical protein